MASQNTLGFVLKNYRAIVISIGFFLVFDLSVMILNFYISSQIKGDAVAVNLAGRQRMLSQRMVKSLYEIDGNLQRGADLSSSLSELRNTYTLFDKTLNSFHIGGRSTGGNGQPVEIAAVSPGPGQTAIDEALVIWQPFRAKLQMITESHHDALAGLIPETIAYAKLNNLSLLKLMNDLTSNLESVAASKANRLRAIQTVGILLALGNFFLILFHFLKQLKERDQAVEQAKQENEEILSTVKEGLFLIDANYHIGSQYSRQMETLLNEDTLAGQDFIEIIKRHIPADLVKIAKDYLDLLFEGRVKEKLVTSLNPLQDVQFKTAEAGYHSKHKYLDFSFNRVVERSGVKHILVTASDVTQKVTLMKELELSEINNKIQIELLLDMLRVDPGTLKTFINETEIELYGINQILKAHRDHAHRDKLKEIYAKVHTIKGNAATIEMTLFEQRMHEFEDAIVNVLDMAEQIDGKDFLALAIKLESSLTLVETVRNFLERIIAINRTFTEANAESILSARYFERLVNRISADKGKKIVIDYNQFNPDLIPGNKHSHIRDIVLQLVRNSVVHGIEAPLERKLRNKDEIGRITLATQQDAKGIKVVVRDDGRGINVDAIRDRAIQSGIWQADEISTWNQTKLISLIFEEQFSTAEKIDRDAGRGIGMSSVKHTLKHIGGNLGIKFVPGQFCEFQISLPAV